MQNFYAPQPQNFTQFPNYPPSYLMPYYHPVPPNLPYATQRNGANGGWVSVPVSRGARDPRFPYAHHPSDGSLSYVAPPISDENFQTASSTFPQLQDSTPSGAFDGMWIGGDSPKPPQDDTPINQLARLARFNRISPKYELVDEKGPAHRKVFSSTVTFMLNGKNEVYVGEGPSIKASSHNAALAAVQDCTGLRRPPEKSRFMDMTAENCPPVARLNLLAVKRKSWADYQDFRRPLGPFGPLYWGTNLFVCGKVFHGFSDTKISARNDAAQHALDYLEKCRLAKAVVANLDSRREESIKTVALKGPVCLLYEMSKRSRLDVLFDVITVEGPAHAQMHRMKCVVGDMETTGEGTSKKEAKHSASEKMIAKMESAPAVNPIDESQEQTSPQALDRRIRTNPLKVSKARPDYGKNINPISRLCQLQQAKNAPDPVYEIAAADASPGCIAKEFVATVRIPGCEPMTGTATSKKLAKRFAAENFLKNSGAVFQQLATQKSNLKTAEPEATDAAEKGDRRVTFDLENPESEDKQNGRTYRRRFVKYPRPNTLYPNESVEETIFQAVVVDQSEPDELVESNLLERWRSSAPPLPVSLISAIASELLAGPSSTTAKKFAGLDIADLCPGRDLDNSCLVEYLCRLANATLKRETFAKQGPHAEFVTVLTVGEPVESIGCGGGATKEISANDAARNLLNVVAEQGEVMQICAEKNRLVDASKGVCSPETPVDLNEGVA